MAGEKALSRCISSSSRRPARLSMSHQRPGSRLASSSSSSTSSSTAPSSSSSSSITPPNFTFAPTSRAAKVPKALINDSTPASELSKTFNLTAHPHASSYAALLSRIAGAEGLQNNLQLVEACCICPSFWSDVDTLDAANAKGPFTLFHDQDRLDNRQLSSLGNALLGLFATEWLERRMPNLPTSVLKSALTMFVGPHTAADVARTWGVLPGKASFQPTQPSSESAATSKGCVRERKSSVRGQGEGWRAGTGVLRWSRQPVSEKDTGLELWQNGSSFQDAMASVAKAFVGAVHQEMVRGLPGRSTLSISADVFSCFSPGPGCCPRLCARPLLVETGRHSLPAQVHQPQEHPPSHDAEARHGQSRNEVRFLGLPFISACCKDGPMANLTPSKTASRNGPNVHRAGLRGGHLRRWRHAQAGRRHRIQLEDGGVPRLRRCAAPTLFEHARRL